MRKRGKWFYDRGGGSEAVGLEGVVLFMKLVLLRLLTLPERMCNVSRTIVTIVGGGRSIRAGARFSRRGQESVLPIIYNCVRRSRLFLDFDSSLGGAGVQIISSRAKRAIFSSVVANASFSVFLSERSNDFSVCVSGSGNLWCEWS